MTNRTSLHRVACAVHEVDLWLIAITDDEQVFRSNWSFLSLDEQERATRFLKEADRRRFVITRGALRERLGQTLSEHPKYLTFAYDQNRKPFLMDHTELRFNVSHAGDFAMIGLSRVGNVGVDIEVYHDNIDECEIARTFFTDAEQEVLKSLEGVHRTSAFYAMWTYKEAMAKAIGIGIARFNPCVPESVLDDLSCGRELRCKAIMNSDICAAPVVMPCGYFGTVAFHRPLLQAGEKDEPNGYEP